MLPSSHRGPKSTRGHRVSSRTICWIIFMIMSIVSLFFFIVYHSHLQMNFENEADSARLYVKNKLAVIPQISELSEKVIQIEESIVNRSWIGKGRKEIEDYLLRLSEQNKHAFQGHLMPGATGPGVSIGSVEPLSLPEEEEQADEGVGDHKVELITTTTPPKREHHESAPLESLNCPAGNLVSYWKETTSIDKAFKSPFAVSNEEFKRTSLSKLQEKYITFEPDVGGWNNIRMQLEVVLVFALASGRTLVIPPEQAMYLLDKGKGKENAHSFEDYFPFDKLRTRIKIITMEEFLRREGITGHLVAFNDSGLVLYPPQNKTVVNAMNRPEKRKMWAYIRSVAYCPKWEPFHHFLVFPPRPGLNVSTLPDASQYQAARDKFADKRQPIYYSEYLHNQPLIHFISLPEQGYRLLTHSYTFIHFEDPFMDRYHKRFIRDYVHYVDDIFCKGAQIVKEMMDVSGGRYVSFHVRRGELQYKEVKLPASDILLNNQKSIPEDITVAYVATDERNRSFFDAFHQKFQKVYYLDDFFQKLNLKEVNPNFLGMIDQVACTGGEVFIGTWFSTFTGYITRLRGYLGHEEASNFFGDKKHRDRYQKYEVPKFPFYMREWRESWADIDE